MNRINTNTIKNSLNKIPQTNYMNVFVGIVFIILLIIFVFIGLYSKSNLTSSISLIISFILLIISLGNFFTFKGVKNSVVKYPFQLYLILFIIFLIYFFTYASDSLLPENFINNNANILLPIILVIGFLLFFINIFNNVKTNIQYETNPNNLKINACIIFISLLVFITLLYSVNPGGFISEYFGVSLIFIILIIVFGFLYLMTILFDSKIDFLGTTFKNAMIIFFGISFSSLIIGWLIYSIQNLSHTSGIVSFIFNIFIVLAILGLIFKLFSTTDIYKKSPITRLIVDSILYLPCIFVNIIELLTKMKNGIGSKFTSSSTSSLNNQENVSTYYILIGIILLYILYFAIIPMIKNKIFKQDGLLLINRPIPLKEENIIASYQTLNKSEKLDYHYGISFWLYFDSTNGITNTSSNKFTSVLNYGDKPNVLYSPSLNKLRITMKNNNNEKINQNQLLDDNGNIILYEKSDILLQKWNNIIINYNGGTLDIFYNGELVKTNLEIVPYIEYDNLIVGSNNGIYGGICNLNYFNKSLDIQQIYYLYNLVKNKTPPIIYDLKKYIIPIDTYDNIPSSSFDISVNALKNVITKDIKSVSDEIITPPNLDTYNSNKYLSLKWYFTANNDDQNI